MAEHKEEQKEKEKKTEKEKTVKICNYEDLPYPWITVISNEITERQKNKTLNYRYDLNRYIRNGTSFPYAGGAWICMLPRYIGGRFRPAEIRLIPVKPGASPRPYVNINQIVSV